MKKPKPKKKLLQLPDSYIRDFDSYKLPLVNDNILVLSDLHFPYQNNTAIEIALEEGKKSKINTILLNGDILDMYQLSTYEKDPRQRSVKEELEAVRQFLDLLKQRFPRAKIFYKTGNHEMRWERWMQRNAYILIGNDEFRLDVLLDLRNRGIEFITDQRPIMAGELMILHGNEIKGSGGINPAKSMIDKLGINSICGDKHRTQMFVKPTANGKILCAWSTGHLGEANPQYMPLNQWNLGFAIITVDDRGIFNVRNLIIDTTNGRIY